MAKAAFSNSGGDKVNMMVNGVGKLCERRAKTTLVLSTPPWTPATLPDSQNR
jgi:hypothetical protein